MYNDLLVYDAHSLNVGDVLSFKKIIEDIKNIKPKIILFLSILEYEMPHVNDRNEYDKLNNLLIENNIQFYILIGSENSDNLEEFQKKSEFKYVFWPTSMLHYFYNRIEEHLVTYDTNRNFEKLYVCFNGKARCHRVKLIDSLFKNNLFDYGQISWNQLTKDFNEGQKCNFQFWDEKILLIDNNNFFQKLYDNTSFFDLVSETTSSHSLRTEKIYRPLLFEQIFLCLGCKDINKNLKNYGFEIFEEIFNYDFDSKSTVNGRIDGIIENIKNLKDKDLNELYNIIKPKLKHNKKRAIEIVENDEYIPEILIQLFKNYRDSFGKYIKFYNLDYILKNKLK